MPLEMAHDGASGQANLKSKATATPTGSVSSYPGYLKFSVDLEKRKALEDMASSVPESLRARGVGEDEWRTVCECLLKFQEANFFYKNCGGAESGSLCQCCYLCVPLGPLQMYLCLANPCTWALCITPAAEAATKATAEIDDVLNKHGVQCRVNTDDDDKVEFWHTDTIAVSVRT